MFVQKRDGTRAPVRFDKITQRIERMSEGLQVEPVAMAQRVINGVYNDVRTSELDELASSIASNLVTTHPDYSTLAARLFVSNLHKVTTGSFSLVTSIMYEYVEPVTSSLSPLLSTQYVEFVRAHMDKIDETIDYERDFQYDYFGLKTLQRSYLIKVGDKIVERPQDMLMRVACGIHTGDIDAALETYELLSGLWFTHASPTLFSAGTPAPQMSSCYLLTMKEDSVEGIFDTLKQCASISKHAGGIGLSVSTIRATGSHIRGTNGTSNGIVPMLRVFNNTARYVDQGGGKRKGAIAVYMEPWHADIKDFIELRKNNGVEESRTRDIFLGLWIPDLFMERVQADEEWSLFCPNEAPGLSDVWGDEFLTLYTTYEKNPLLVRERMKARELWTAILDAQIETGVPYMLYKDACNRKSNQRNIGTIRGSNLCTEIIQYTSPDEVAVCNLASIALSKFVSSDGTSFDFDKLYEVTRVVCTNLNRIIDNNYYPVQEARHSNFKHRPIGIGVQGLADTFAMMRMPFESDDAQRLNKDIFETIYYAACTRSMELSKVHGPYETYEGSPISEGKFQFDLWGLDTPTGRWDWESLRTNILTYGVRNSLLVAPMPTASTSQILGNNECFEPYTSNLYVRRTLAGEFICVSRHLVKELLSIDMWSTRMKDSIIAGNGSIQHIESIPSHIREIYKTVWEIKGKCLVDMAVDRGQFIDQSQSFNVHMNDVTISKLTSLHFYAWKRGLKTGMYYLRTRAAADALKVTVCSLENQGECTSCSG